MTDERNPWKTVSSETVYTNPWMTVREDQVIRPDGKPGIYGVVETRIATGALALTEQNEVYLVGQYRYPTEVYSWEIIQGGTDPGENPLECAKRELQEEAGLIADMWHPLGGEIHLSNCISSEVGYIYIAQDLTETQATPDGTEVLEIVKMPMAEAVAMVHANKIYDAVSILGILYAERWLRERG